MLLVGTRVVCDASVRAPPVFASGRASSVQPDHWDSLLDLHSQLLFSTSQNQLPARVRSLVSSSLRRKYEANEAEELDSASKAFEAFLAELRCGAGFGDATPWRDPDCMPWADALRETAPVLQEELRVVLSEDRDSSADGRGVSWESASYEAIAPSWRVMHLWQGGSWRGDAASRFPRSVEALRELEARHGLRLNPLQDVACGIARQPACSGIAPHCDGNLLGLTCHLGLSVPEGCAIEVGGEARAWREAELLLMDTTFVHRTWNDSPNDRYVLMLNVLRPGVRTTELEHVQRYLRAPSLRLHAFNPSYAWMPADAGDANVDGTTTNNDDARTALDASTEGAQLTGAASAGGDSEVAAVAAGDLFVAASPAVDGTGLGLPGQRFVEVAPSRWLPLSSADASSGYVRSGMHAPHAPHAPHAQHQSLRGRHFPQSS